MPASPLRSFLAHSLALKGKTHEQMIEVCLHAGFSGIEAHPFISEGLDELALTKIAERYHACGLKIESYHLPFLDLASLDEPVRHHALESFKRTLRHAGALGARVGIVHPTITGCTVVSGLDPLLNALEKSLSELLPLAESLGVTLALENLSPAGANRLGSTPEHFEIFEKRFAHDSLGFCLDTGHALLSLHDRAFEQADAMKRCLVALHITDNPGDRDSHLAPGRGNVNWPEVSQLLRELEFTHAACIEAPPFAFGPDYSLAAWKQLYHDTAALLPL